MKLQTSLVAGAFSLVLFIAGCTASQTPGPPGPQGQPGATGQTGDSSRDADQRRAEDQRRADEQRRGDEQRGADEQKRADDKTRGGHDEPCPSGEHSHTDPGTGKTSCIRD